MLLNMKKQANKEFEEQQNTIKVGESKVQQSSSTNPLGVTIEENQGWAEHINKTTKALNRRTSAIRRIMAQMMCGGPSS